MRPAWNERTITRRFVPSSVATGVPSSSNWYEAIAPLLSVAPCHESVSACFRGGRVNDCGWLGGTVSGSRPKKPGTSVWISIVPSGSSV